MKNSGYSLENAQSFGWASLTGNLNVVRVEWLRQYLVGQEILDAGCGGGGYVKFLSAQGLRVTGIDKFEEFLEVARANYPEGVFTQSDITDLPFENDFFDCTFCFDVLEHVDDYAAIQELARVTRKRLIIAVPREDKSLDDYGITLRHYIDHTHLRYYTEDSLKALADSVHPRKVSTFLELPLDFAGISTHLATLKLTRDAPVYLKFLLAFYFLKQLVSQVARRKRLDLSLARQVAHQKVDGHLRNMFFKQFSFKQIYTGVVAIIDFE